MSRKDNRPLGTDGTLYIADPAGQVIRRVASHLPGYSLADILISSADGEELYHFDPTGRHLRTLNSITGAPIYSYDDDELLTQAGDLAITHDPQKGGLITGTT